QRGRLDVDEGPLRPVLPVPAAEFVVAVVALDEFEDLRARDRTAEAILRLVETGLVQVDEMPAAAPIEPKPSEHGRDGVPARHRLQDLVIHCLLPPGLHPAGEMRRTAPECVPAASRAGPAARPSGSRHARPRANSRASP